LEVALLLLAAEAERAGASPFLEKSKSAADLAKLDKQALQSAARRRDVIEANMDDIDLDDKTASV
jgi:hypothetical protein